MAKNLRKDRRPPRAPLFDMEGVVSSTECTGMAATPIMDDNAAASYDALYPIHHQKAEGDVGEKKE